MREFKIHITGLSVFAEDADQAQEMVLDALTLDRFVYMYVSVIVEEDED